MDDPLPRIGLAAAALALIALPLWKHLERENAPRVGEGPDFAIEIAGEIDAFWSRAFPEQFPDASIAYRSPKLRFDDVDGASLAAQDQNAGYYVGDREIIHVDVDNGPGGDRQRGYIAFVLSHEFGHHVQNLSGMQLWIDRRRSLSFPERSRRLGVRYELQAECFSGVWAREAAAAGREIGARDVILWRALLSAGGGDRTHGTGDQRRSWFDRGYESGAVTECDTFSPEWEAL